MPEESSKVRTARHGIIYVGGQLMGSVAILLTLIILARQLKPAYLGLYAIVIAFYTLLGLVSTFSLGTTMRKKLADRKSIAEKRRLVSNAYMISLTFSLMVALFGIALSRYAAINIYHNTLLVAPLVLASLLVVFWSLFNLTISVLVGAGRVIDATVIDVLYSILQMVLSPMLVALGYGVLGAVAGLAIAIIIGTAAGFVYIAREFGILRLSVDRETLNEVITFSIPVFISLMVVQAAYYLGILVLGSYASPEIFGNYNLAYELGGAFSIIITSMMFVLLPTFSEATVNTTKKGLARLFNRSIYYSILVIAPLLALVASSAKPIIYLLFSRSYIYAPQYLGIIAFGMVLGIVWNYANILVLGMGDTRNVLRYQVAAAAIQVGLLVVLTPVFGVVGLMVGLFLVSPIAINLLYINLIRGRLGIRLDLRKTCRIAAATVVLFALLYGTGVLLGKGYLSLAANVAMTILLYPPLAAAFRGFDRKDISLLRRIIGERKFVSPFASFFDYAEMFAR
jgi:O-antigen/teichoic acid export membrane protein